MKKLVLRSGPLYFSCKNPGNFYANYRNDPNFLYRWDWTNSADPDQTAPIGAV